MAGITFFNVRSGETREVSLATVGDARYLEAHLSALYNSSNLNPNGLVQDFGWRLGKDTIQKMNEIQADEVVMDRLATRYQIPIEDVKVPDILRYILAQDTRQAQIESQQKEGDFTREYEDSLRDIDAPSTTAKDAPAPAESTKKAAKPKRLTAAQKKVLADEKRREDNIAAGRDLNDGIKTPPVAQDDDGETAVDDSDKTLAKSDDNDDNDA